jgi:hypothetical protein
MMKMNKWTMALAAAGVVSLSSVAQAQEAVAGAEAEAASGTLTGYVSTSYTMVKDGVAPAGYWNAAANSNGYALDVIDLKWAKAQGGGEYASGYTVDLWVGGADIGAADAGNRIQIMEANIDLRVPVGSGLNLKVGYFGTVVGAEKFNYTDNAFYSRSFGFQVEPTHHTGILASYQVSEDLAVKVGVANDTTDNGVNAGGDAGNRGTALLANIQYTLPDSLGPLGGASLEYGTVAGAGADGAETDTHYLGLALPVPGVEGLTYQLAVDIVEKEPNSGASDSVVGHYLSYGINDKMTLNVRYETGNINAGIDTEFGDTQNLDGLESWTVGLDYKLWENVTSRVEYRLDDADGVTSEIETLAVNLIYTF